jgi:hypothetical protein
LGGGDSTIAAQALGRGLYTILCAISTALQGASAFLTINGQYKVWEKTKEETITDKPSIPFVVWMLLLGAFLSAFTGVWMGYHPPKPQVVTVDRAVEKNCLATQTGPATARGSHDATAHSGNGDTMHAEIFMVTSNAPSKQKPR